MCYGLFSLYCHSVRLQEVVFDVDWVAVLFMMDWSAGCVGHRFGHRAVCQSLSSTVERLLQSMCVHRSGAGALDTPPDHHAHSCRYDSNHI